MAMNTFLFAGLVTTTVMSVAVFGAYRRKLNRVKQRVSEGGKIAQTKVGPIEYDVTGSGPSALVIHGAGGGYDQGLLLAQSLPQFRVIAPSRFGYLRTPVPGNASAAAQAAAHAALLDSLGVCVRLSWPELPPGRRLPSRWRFVILRE
jgi:2-hydroxy-6-oxonona-2,4-dienedioate hydrolase